MVGQRARQCQTLGQHTSRASDPIHLSRAVLFEDDAFLKRRCVNPSCPGGERSEEQKAHAVFGQREIEPPGLNRREDEPTHNGEREYQCPISEESARVGTRPRTDERIPPSSQGEEKARVSEDPVEARELVLHEER